MHHWALLSGGTASAVFVGVVALQEALSPETSVTIPAVISLGLLIGAALVVFRAGNAFGDAMRTVRKAAEFGATVEGLVDTVEALRQRVEVLERDSSLYKGQRQ